MPQSRRISTRTSSSTRNSSIMGRSESDRRKSLNPNRVPWNPSNQNNRTSISQSFSPRLSKGEKYREQTKQTSKANARTNRQPGFSNQITKFQPIRVLEFEHPAKHCRR